MKYLVKAPIFFSSFHTPTEVSRITMWINYTRYTLMELHNPVLTRNKLCFCEFNSIFTHTHTQTQTQTHTPEAFLYSCTGLHNLRRRALSWSSFPHFLHLSNWMAYVSFVTDKFHAINRPHLASNSVGQVPRRDNLIYGLKHAVLVQRYAIRTRNDLLLTTRPCFYRMCVIST